MRIHLIHLIHIYIYTYIRIEIKSYEYICYNPMYIYIYTCRMYQKSSHMLFMLAADVHVVLPRN